MKVEQNVWLYENVAGGINFILLNYFETRLCTVYCCKNDRYQLFVQLLCYEYIKEFYVEHKKTIGKNINFEGLYSFDLNVLLLFSKSTKQIFGSSHSETDKRCDLANLQNLVLCYIIISCYTVYIKKYIPCGY